MRLKFEKGMTPERVAEGFVKFIRENDIVIGSINMYIQTYDENMKAEPYNKGDDYYVVKPSDYSKKEYKNDVARLRRKKIKVI